MSVGPFDLGILAVYLAGIIVLGLWIGRRSDTVAEFVVGGRDRPWWLILFSIVATETSTVTFLSIPGFAYTHDMTWLQIPLGFLLGRFAVVFLFVPQYFKGSFYTAYDVLHQRFGGATQKAASAMFIVTRSLADGLRLFLSAIVLQEMTGIPLHWAVVAMGVGTIIYTFFGGIRSVLVTDMVQFLIYIAGAVIALFIIIHRLPGGWEQLMAVGGAAHKFRVFDLSLDWTQPYGLWAGLIGGLFITLGSHGVDQMMVQRYLCASSKREAQRALWVGGFVVVAQFALFLLIGVGLFVFYQVVAPDMVFERPDRVFARFILDEMPVGLLGILLGAIFAAAMSTLSSSLNSCATAAANDFWFSSRDEEASAKTELQVVRILTVIFGLIQIGVGVAGQWVKSSVVSSVLGIAAFTTGIVLGVFFLGIFSKRVGQRAALVGLVLGLGSMSVIFFTTPLAWPWFALVGSAITFAVGWAASYLVPQAIHNEGDLGHG